MVVLGMTLHSRNMRLIVGFNKHVRF